MTDLADKKILLFSSYGACKHYGQAIAAELHRRGAYVDEYNERPSQNSLMKIVIRLFKKTLPQIFNSYINKVVAENKHKDYDFILICKGEAFTPDSIGILRTAYPRSKVILYLWDIMHDCNDYKMADVLDSCDKCLSFDPVDATQNHIFFRPTFFVDEYLSVKDKKEFTYDLSFIGTLYSPRHKLIAFLDRKFEEQSYKFYMYLYIPGIVKYMKEFICHFPFYPIRKVNFSPMSLGETINILNECQCILDLNPPYQTSVSTRAHEAIAARRKYITNSQHIKDYEYYNPNNIFIIDVDNPIIPKEFFETPFEPVSESVLYKYSVRGVVDDLFSGV